MSGRRPGDADMLRKGQLNAQRATESMESAALQAIRSSLYATTSNDHGLARARLSDVRYTEVTSRDRF